MEYPLHITNNMIFRRKSRIERASDVLVNVLKASSGVINAVGNFRASGNRQGHNRVLGGRRGRGMGLLAVAAPLVWTNRERIRKAAVAAVQAARERWEASKEALEGGAQESQQQSGQQGPEQREQPQEQQAQQQGKAA